jgi:hypothetical protein
VSQRVLATETALGAARRMHAVLSGDVQARVGQIVQLGQRLSDPGVWDGVAAASFRRTWPQDSARLESTLRALAALEGHAQDVLQAIEKAGTDGQLNGVGSRNGASWENTFGNVTSLVGIAGWFGAPVVSTLLGRAEGAEKAAEEAAKANQAIERLMYEDFSSRVRPVMQALSRGDATFADLERAVRGTEETVGEWNAALKVNTAFREAFEESARGIGWFRGADITLGPLAMISDVSTLWHPNGHGTMAWVDRGAAAVDLGLTGADTGIAIAGLFGAEAAMPGIGEVAMLGTGAYLMGSYLYQHWTPFRDVANDVGHAVAGVAKGAWHAISSIF